MNLIALRLVNNFKIVKDMREQLYDSNEEKCDYIRIVLISLRSCLRAVGQVMFQCNALSGILILIGIFHGAYANGTPIVAWGAVVGVLAAMFAGFIMQTDIDDGKNGLWGFNGVLVGCAFPTFFGNTWQMWVALIFCAMLSTWMRQAFNNVSSQYKINSLTFPFVILTWAFLLSGRMLHGFDVEMSMSLPIEVGVHSNLDYQQLLSSWLKGISQVFLINDATTGIWFLLALAINRLWAAIWAAIGSAMALVIAIIFQADALSIQEGLLSYSSVLTAIAIGCTFYRVNKRSFMWTIAAIFATVFMQASLDAVMLMIGLPSLTGAFCITVWLFLLPLYKLDERDNPDHSFWKSLRKL